MILFRFGSPQSATGERGALLVSRSPFWECGEREDKKLEVFFLKEEIFCFYFPITENKNWGK